MKTSVFLSYSRKDTEFAKVLRKQLSARGINVFRDIDDTVVGEEWRQRLEQLIVKADIFAFVLSNYSADSEECRRELQLAMSLNKRICPVVIDQVNWQAMPDGLAKIHSVYFDRETIQIDAINNLVEAFEVDIGWIREHTRLGEQAFRWNSNQLTEQLLRGKELLLAEDWLSSRPASTDIPSEIHFLFINASRNLARKHRNFWTIGLVLGLLFSTGLALFAFQQKEAADANYKVAKGAADGLVFDIAQGLRDKGIPSDTVNLILYRAATAFNSLSSQIPDDSGLLRSQAVMRNEFAKTYLIRGETTKGLEEAKRSLSIASMLMEMPPMTAQKRGDVAAGNMVLGDLTRVLKTQEDARVHYDQARLNYENASLLESKNPQWQRNLSAAYGRLGQTDYWLGKLEQSSKQFELALEIDRKIAKENPNDAVAQRHVMASLNNIANVAQALGDVPSAQTYYIESTARAEILLKEDASNSRVLYSFVVALENLGDTYKTLGDLDAAQSTYKKSLDFARKLNALDKENTMWERELSVAHNKNGDIALAMGQYEEAINYFRKSLSIRENLVKNNPDSVGWKRDLAVIFSKIGDWHLAKQEFDKAYSLFSKSLTIRKRLLNKDPKAIQTREDVAYAYLRVGDVKKHMKDMNGAETAFTESLQRYQSIAKESNNNAEVFRNLSVPLTRLGELFHDTGAHVDALKMFGEVYKIRKSLLASRPSHGEWKRDLGVVLFNLGLSRQALGQHKDAINALSESMKLRRELYLKDNDNTLWSTDLVEVLWQLGEVLGGVDGKTLLVEAENIAKTLYDSSRLPSDKLDWPENIGLVLDKLY